MTYGQRWRWWQRPAAKPPRPPLPPTHHPTTPQPAPPTDTILTSSWGSQVKGISFRKEKAEITAKLRVGGTVTEGHD